MSNQKSFRRMVAAGVAFAVFVLALSFGGQAKAAIMYSNIVQGGTTFPGATPPDLFGTPTVIGNNLYFNPSLFKAAAGDGFAFTDGLLSLTMMTDTPQNSIGNFAFQESGGYTLFNGTFSSPIPNPATSALASINVITAQVVEIAGVPVAPIIVPRNITYSNLGNGVSTLAGGGIRFTTNGDETNFPIINQGWQADVSFDVLSVTSQATKINLFLNNVLFVQAEEDAFAYIDKKNIQIIPTEIIPEPSTIVLGSLGGLLLLAARRWRKVV